eukprot:1157850-Pelagomonas_calceolata.AAC.13
MERIRLACEEPYNTAHACMALLPLLPVLTCQVEFKTLETPKSPSLSRPPLDTNTFWVLMSLQEKGWQHGARHQFTANSVLLDKTARSTEMRA